MAATDLAFSDLVLWVLDRDPDVFWAAAQIRPDYADIGALVRGHGSCRVQ